MACSPVPRIKVALFDMAATTVNDLIEKPGLQEPLPLVISAYRDAFAAANIEMPFDELNDCRGRDKIEVFREKVIKYRKDLGSPQQEALARMLHDQEFVPALLENVPYVTEMPGTSGAFNFLRERGIFVATGSGFPPEVTDAINGKLGWLERGLVDYGTCGGRAGGGRPHPHQIHDVLIAAEYLPPNIDKSTPQPDFDYRTVLKVGDTVKDIEEGRNVGAVTVAVSSGTQSVEKLVAAEPRVVIPSVAALPLYLKNHGLVI